MKDNWECEPADGAAGTAFEREAIRVLRRLSEAGAVLAVAEAMEKAVVARDDGTGSITRTAVVEVETAQALALNGWIACRAPGRVSRYRITASGRSVLGQMIAAAENRARSGTDTGFAEAQSSFAGRPPGQRTAQDGSEAGKRRTRYGTVESPLLLLARRKDRDGKPFLSEDLVAAGERLREDFELAQTSAQMIRNPDSRSPGGRGGGYGAEAARRRVADALAELGPGLRDVALRCCCHLEGLEQTEKRMGWSARSGKIVLRIALQRLSCHYAAAASEDRMIG